MGKQHKRWEWMGKIADYHGPEDENDANDEEPSNCGLFTTMVTPRHLVSDEEGAQKLHDEEFAPEREQEQIDDDQPKPEQETVWKIYQIETTMMKMKSCKIWLLGLSNFKRMDKPSKRSWSKTCLCLKEYPLHCFPNPTIKKMIGQKTGFMMK